VSAVVMSSRSAHFLSSCSCSFTFIGLLIAVGGDDVLFAYDIYITS
jgi:hypothetical protein